MQVQVKVMMIVMVRENLSNSESQCEDKVDC